MEYHHLHYVLNFMNAVLHYPLQFANMAQITFGAVAKGNRLPLVVITLHAVIPNGMQRRSCFAMPVGETKN